MLPSEIEQLVLQAAGVLKAHGAREVYVFGSFFAGDIRPDSDIDLAVRGLPPGSFFSAAGAATSKVGRIVDLIDLDSAIPFAEYLRGSGELRRVA